MSSLSSGLGARCQLSSTRTYFRKTKRFFACAVSSPFVDSLAHGTNKAPVQRWHQARQSRSGALVVQGNLAGVLCKCLCDACLVRHARSQVFLFLERPYSQQALQPFENVILYEIPPALVNCCNRWRHLGCACICPSHEKYFTLPEPPAQAKPAASHNLWKTLVLNKCFRPLVPLSYYIGGIWHSEGTFTNGGGSRRCWNAICW